MTLHVEMDRLAHLGPTLQKLAGEAGRLNSNLPMCPIPGQMEPAVLEASEIARDVVDSALVSALKERLSETGEVMVNVANEYRHADEPKTGLDTSPVTLESVMAVYTNATGDWVVPEAPK
jgi:hypothetical protein